MARFAEIVVNTHVHHRARGGDESTYTPAGLTFHYSIPPELAATLRPGHLVRVPFRQQTVQGIIIALHDKAPVPETRPILDLVYPEPVLTSTQLRLARWMSETYLSPLLNVLKLFLPPRLTAVAEPVLELVPDATLPPDLTPEQILLVERLRAGPQPEKRLRQGKHNLARDAILRPLLERGIVRRRRVAVGRPPRPRMEEYVRLTADEDTIAHILPQLGRHSPRADVLHFLLTYPDPLPTVEEVCRATGCSPALLKRMAADGEIVLEPARRRAVLTLLRQDVQAHLDALTRAPAQAHALRTLANLGGDALLSQLQAEGVSRQALLGLARRGWVRILEEPATLHLNLDVEEAEQRIIALRGTAMHRRVLQALAQEEEPVWIGWLLAETGASRKVLRDLEEAGLISLEQEEIIRDPLALHQLPTTPERPPTLTADQERVWEQIRARMITAEEGSGAEAQETSPPIFLVQGVTGSGKTEIYLRAAAEVLSRSGQVLFLVPEIALTPQTIQRVAARFPQRLAVWHGSLSVGQRFDTWRRLMAGEIDIVVGTRSALFAPFSRLRLIVVDEEHDESYKNQRQPAYHSRDVAIQLARLTGATVILGSATPDIVTYTRARRGDYHLLRLPQRILAHRRQLEQMAEHARLHGEPLPSPRWRQLSPKAPDARTIPLPPVRIVDMRLELKAGNRSMLSRALQQGIRRALAARQQVILFINRRGRASFVMCRDCGYVLKCERCSVPLTFHVTSEGTRPGEERGYLLCHHCNRRYPVPKQCPECHSKRIRYFGGGTQRVEAEVRRLFPQARILRWDRDTTRNHEAHWHILQAFANHEADILIGTQMLAKGLDLPRVTLVGVVSADEGLFLPDFRTGERTFQVLTQVAGRAGRGLWGGRVIVQTYHPTHYAIRAAAYHNYEQFYRHEMAFRKQMLYPPYTRLVRLLYTHTQEHRAQQEAERLAEDVREVIQRYGFDDISLIGPAPCFFTRLRGQYRWHIILRGRRPTEFLKRFPLPQGWRVDVDPYNTL